jgi:hypothetical protein
VFALIFRVDSIEPRNVFFSLSRKSLRPLYEVYEIQDLCFMFVTSARNRHCATSWKIAGSSPDEMDFFVNLANPSSRTMSLGSPQPLTEMSTRSLHGCKGRPACKADNLTAICEPIV